MRNGLPLAWRFIGSTLVIVAGVSFVVGRQSFREDRQLLERDQFVLGERLVHSGAIYCIEPLAARDYPVIDTFVRDLVDADTDVLCARQRSVEVCFDQTTRRSTAMPDGIRDALATRIVSDEG